ncbi:MAG: ATP-binding protein [Candidatus Doudnabacteria bacterium]|nr:ATP-binding protein [Candidatus Doudnabacteria bacterium]
MAQSLAKCKSLAFVPDLVYSKCKSFAFMKIAFVGKGGSGKTTTSTLFCRYLQQNNCPVLAIEADINQHMKGSLGLPLIEVLSLGTYLPEIKEYLRGSNPRIESASEMIKTSPPGAGSNLLRLKETNPLFEKFSISAGSLRFMAVGEFSEEDLGVKCYHSKVGAVELLLNHMLDREDEYVVVDMTAGADTFASGMFTKFDITFVVVEPTLKSVSVFEQYKKFAKDYDVKVVAIGNKISDNSDLQFLQNKLGEDLLVYFGQSDFVKNSERGEVISINFLEEQNIQALKKLIQIVGESKKDWTKFYRQTVEFHIKNSESWGNVSIGKDLRKQVDPDFVLRD